MNDRYLFRAKRTGNGEWVEGYYAFIDDVHYIYTGSLCNCGLYVVAERFEVNTSTICQCAGLTDKSGMKIYEGDILREGDAIGIVKFGKYKNDFHFGYYIHWINYPNLRPELGFWNGRSDVIGNIFANPELLEVGE